jgi:hypothetical protein
VRPFGPELVAIVRVAWPRFHFLMLHRDLYFHLHDPFAIAERFPPPWDARGSLAELTWPAEPLPPRTVEMLDAILKNGDGPFLLGSAQILVDGGQIAVQRPIPDLKLVRDVWALLPDSTRRQVWPASFTFSNELRFDLVVIPDSLEGGLRGYAGEDQARDYPESRYERSLQVAVESGDRQALEQLLARRNVNEMIRIAVLVICSGFGAMVILKLLSVFGVF